jgi:hypothetical protein
MPAQWATDGREADRAVRAATGPDGGFGRDSGSASDDAREGGARHEAAAQCTAALLPASHREEGALYRRRPHRKVIANVWRCAAETVRDAM